jgi:hypothetical protein
MTFIVESLAIRKRASFAFSFLVAFFFCGTLTFSEESSARLQFNRDIRPILSDKCFACHGTDAKHRQAELRLDTVDGATQVRNDMQAVVPGNPDQSQLFLRIQSTDADEQMPPPDSHKELTAAEKVTIRKWIEQGAEYQKHWSFEMLGQPNVPPPWEANVIRNPIDSFIQQRLAEAKLSPSEEADKSTLLRRVSFAITGLPPTIDEQDQYFSDSSGNAYESMVDRYLESNQYGEEMARHWLDVARYADTHGMHLDNERQTWAYRDWVVSAFNRNLPFDEFTIEQLAGDLLPNATQDQLIATGFNRCNVTSSEGGSIDAELIYRYAVDRTSTTMQAWLGLTGGCAVCHDHKFDPISQREFYSMYAFFNSAADPAMDGNALLTQPVLRLENQDSVDNMKSIDSKILEVAQQRTQLASEIEYTDPAAVIPLPEPIVTESIWLDDQFPSNGKMTAVGAPLSFVDSSDTFAVTSGTKALKRSDAGLAQDVWESSNTPLIIPTQAKIIAQVWLDPANLPKSIMLQFHRTGWQHRAVWGDYNAIDWGVANTTERVDMGPLPEAGKWVQLEVPVEKVGLNSGDLVTGFALTQFGGTTYWDKVGAVGISNKAADPNYSFVAWLKHTKNLDPAAVDESIRAIVQATDIEKSFAEADSALRNYFISTVCSETKPRFAAIDNQTIALNAERKAIEDALPSTFVFRDLPMARESFVMMRGGYDKPGERVQPNVPAVLPPLKSMGTDTTANRLDLARWLVSPEQPLTARVTVNRFWQQFFGMGLVKTSSDFGSQGEMPSHPELLDWLAIEYRDTGWDTKQLVRLMLTSHTFRQSSRITLQQRELDPENRLYAHGPRFRLDAEPIRDNALFVSGLLDLKMGGKGVKPYQPSNIWEPVGFAGSNTRNYEQDHGSALYRRSLYTFYKRTAPPPFMANFDAPNREQSCTRRERSNTPLQALQLMNDVQHVEAARGLAQRLMLARVERGERIRLAYRIVLSREPSASELEIMERQYLLHQDRYTKDVDAAKRLVALGQTVPQADLDPVELASLTLLASTLLNLDETVTRN